MSDNQNQMTLNQRIEKSPFKNVYWFARYLINTDQYAALGTKNESEIIEIVNLLDRILSESILNEEEKFKVLKDTLKTEIKKIFKKGSKKYLNALNFSELLEREINSINDVVILCITVKYVIVPINHALKLIHSNDYDFCSKTAQSILNSLGEENVGKVISTWDENGVKGCLNEERTQVVFEYGRLIDNLNSLQIEHSSLDDNLLLTAFVQEFERRLGQKRKARGGASLESVVDFLFAYYKFKSTEKPSHFDQDLEVDKWFKCKDGWLIGISCKRTLRERWKQLSQADRGNLSHFKIKELWHIITYDNDLSDDKIVRLGMQGQYFYLSDESEVYKACFSHEGKKHYVRPLSKLISDIRANIK